MDEWKRLWREWYEALTAHCPVCYWGDSSETCECTANIERARNVEEQVKRIFVAEASACSEAEVSAHEAEVGGRPTVDETILTMTERAMKAAIRTLATEQEPVEVALFLGAHIFSMTEHVVRLQKRIEKLERRPGCRCGPND